jgi:hypothetical protein
MSGFRGPFGGCSMTTNDDLRRARGRGGRLPSGRGWGCLGAPCSPLTGILAEGWGLDQAGLTSENPMFLAGGGDLTRPD